MKKSSTKTETEIFWFQEIQPKTEPYQNRIEKLDSILLVLAIFFDLLVFCTPLIFIYIILIDYSKKRKTTKQQNFFPLNGNICQNSNVKNKLFQNLQIWQVLISRISSSYECIFNTFSTIYQSPHVTLTKNSCSIRLHVGNIYVWLICSTIVKIWTYCRDCTWQGTFLDSPPYKLRSAMSVIFSQYFSNKS